MEGTADQPTADPIGARVTRAEDVIIEERGDVVVVRPRGDVDVAARPMLRERLEPIDRDVVVDLTDVAFIDSAGIGVLAMQQRRLEQMGRTLRVANATRCVADVLRVTGLESWLDD